MKGLATLFLLACSTLGAAASVDTVVYTGTVEQLTAAPLHKSKQTVPCNKHMGICLTSKSNKLEIW